MNQQLKFLLQKKEKENTDLKKIILKLTRQVTTVNALESL